MGIINDKILRLRKGLNLTQYFFASRVGISQSFLSKVEKSRTQPSIQTVVGVIQEFKVNPLWLLTDGVPDEEMFLTIPRFPGPSCLHILQRIKEALEIGDDGLARKLGLTNHKLALFAAYNQVPYEPILELSRKTSLSLDWVFLGRVPMFHQGKETRSGFSKRTPLSKEN